MLNNVRLASYERGKELLAGGKAGEAVEPLRKAYVFADRMLGMQHPETWHAKQVWEQARNEAALAKLRFRVGDQVTVSSGPHAGARGAIDELLLNHHHAYVIKLKNGDRVQASDEQVEREVKIS